MTGIETMFSASLITKPNIISSLNKSESWSFIFGLHDPAVSCVGDTVLEEDSWFNGVWLGNQRGTKHSLNPGHTTLNPSSDEKYWQFSFVEMGDYDAPAQVDLIR
jgi:hypothetical protein